MSINGIVIIGPPASGKSTIGREIAEFMKMAYISSGDIARSMAAGGCQETKENLERGKLAEETQMRKYIYNALYGCNLKNKSFVLDGFPRNADQYFWLIERFPTLKFYFVDVDIDECFKRAFNRSRIDDCVMTERVKYYKTETMYMIDVISSHDGITKIKNEDIEKAIVRVKEHLSKVSI